MCDAGSASPLVLFGGPLPGVVHLAPFLPLPPWPRYMVIIVACEASSLDSVGLSRRDPASQQAWQAARQATRFGSMKLYVARSVADGQSGMVSQLVCRSDLWHFWAKTAISLPLSSILGKGSCTTRNGYNFFHSGRLICKRSDLSTLFAKELRSNPLWSRPVLVRYTIGQANVSPALSTSDQQGREGQPWLACGSCQRETERLPDRGAHVSTISS